MATLNEAIEIVRDRHLMAVLEEGTITELQTLKTKKFLTENLQVVKKILVEEGVLDGARQHLANNWGKYALGAGAAGVGLGLANHGAEVNQEAYQKAVESLPQDMQTQHSDEIEAGYNNTGTNPIENIKDGATDLWNKAGQTYNNQMEKITGDNYTQSPDAVAANNSPELLKAQEAYKLNQFLKNNPVTAERL